MHCTKNAEAYGLCAAYVKGKAMEMPFEDESFDHVVSNGSLHEWKGPIVVFNELFRVLRKGGRYNISDLKRDVGFLKRMLVLGSTKPKGMRPGLISSLNAAYTVSEITELLRNSKLHGASGKDDYFGLCISGKK